jgi:hypothetical protein
MRIAVRFALLTTLLAAASPALAQTGSRTPPYAEKIQQGMRATMARDFGRAASLFREAIQIEASRPDGYYFLAEMQRIQANMSEALEAFRTCARMASQASSVLYEGRCLQGIADTLEQMPNRHDEARGAWNDVARFADSHQALVTPQYARARISAIDVVAEQERTYVDVRQRIAERERVAREGGGAQGGAQGGGGRR